MSAEEDFAKAGGDALEIEDDEFSEEDDGEEQQYQQRGDPNDDKEPPKQPSKGGSPSKAEQDKVENQHFDMAFEVNDDEDDDVDSGEEEDIVAAQQQQAQPQKNLAAGAKPAALGQKAEGEDDDRPVPGAYNPAEYANLNVSQEVKDLFIHITNFQPQKIDLETKLKPFIPDYIPAVGEVDAQLKMPRPDGQTETLGIDILDEPCLNPEDKTIITMTYMQENVGAANKDDDMIVESIEHADKNPKEVTRWIENIGKMHDNKPLPVVNYSKNMPDMDKLMEEWPQETEQALQQIPFPGPEIDLHPADYAKLVCHMMDIPTHKLANNRAIIESLHTLFSLYSEFKTNVHFNKPQQDQQEVNQEHF